MKILKLLSCFILIITISCNTQDSNKHSDLNLIDFGISQNYDSFLFADSKLDTLTINLNFNFNNWSKQSDSYAKISIVDVNQRSLNKGTKFFFNGSYLEDNSFLVKSSDNDLKNNKISLVLNQLADKDISGLFILEDSDLDRVNEVSVGDENITFLRWKAENRLVMNPLKEVLLYLAIFIASLLFVWFVFLKRIIYKPLPKGQIIIDYPNYKSIKTKNMREIVIGSNPIKQKFLQKVFKGKKLYVNYPSLTKSIIFRPGFNKSLKVILPNSFTIEPITGQIKKDIKYKIKNQDKKFTLKFI